MFFSSHFDLVVMGNSRCKCNSRCKFVGNGKVTRIY